MNCKNFKTVTIKKSLQQVTTWQEQIHIPFKPDGVILKYINKFDHDGQNGVLRGDYINLIYTDLIDHRILFTMSREVNTYQYIDVPFKIHHDVNGYYNFMITGPNGGTPTNNNTFDMYITIVLIFYEK